MHINIDIFSVVVYHIHLHIAVYFDMSCYMEKHLFEKINWIGLSDIFEGESLFCGIQFTFSLICYFSAEQSD